MTLTEIAHRIHEHLKRLEADPAVNIRRDHKHPGPRFYHAAAWRAGRWVYVRYISYQGSTPITRSEAEEYLVKLDAGYTGRHFEMRRQ
jgi:hypothetical protein